VFFGGSVDDLDQARRAAPNLPALRKDFTIDVEQVYESRAIGADAILLIVAALPDAGLRRDLHDLGRELGLTVLVEVHDQFELDLALALDAQVVGVNARDLATFDEDLEVAARLAARIPPDLVAVAESAIRAPTDADRMGEAGFDAVLVGEALVRAPDPARLVATLAATPRVAR
jgi:indole-3-glycerol phosphate synthase